MVNFFSEKVLSLLSFEKTFNESSKIEKYFTVLDLPGTSAFLCPMTLYNFRQSFSENLHQPVSYTSFWKTGSECFKLSVCSAGGTGGIAIIYAFDKNQRKCNIYKPHSKFPEISVTVYGSPVTIWDQFGNSF